jgi:hypothetical protein
MFTQAMFLNNSTGALDAAKYYLDSINWSFALVESRPFTVICDAPTCKRQASVFAEDKRAGRHTIGGRVTEGPPRLIPAPARSGAQWVAQVEVMFAAGHSVDRQGKTVQSYPKGTDRTNLYMKWNGVMWRVAEHALTS